jgi:YHS domain-containing protein
MTRHAAYCWAVILAVFADSSTAQVLENPVQVKTQSPAEIASDPNSQQSVPSRPSIGLDPLQRLTLQISNADFLIDRGDASQSIEELRQAYYAGITAVRAYPAGSDGRFKAIRQAQDAGHLYAWMLADDQQFQSAGKIYQELLEVLKPYDVADPPAPLVLPLARTYWLGSRLAGDRGDDEANAILSRRSEELTKNLDAYPGDYVDLARLRVSILSYEYGFKQDQARARRTEACKLAIDIDRVRPDSSSLRALVQCDLYRAQNLRIEKKFEEAIRLVENSRSRIESRIKSDGENASISSRFLLVNVELALKDIEFLRHANAEASRRQIAAAEAFILALQGRSYSQSNTYEIRTAFSGLREVDFTQIHELTTKDKRDAAEISLYSRIADAVETSRKAFPTSIGYAVASGESLARVANFRLEAGDFLGADQASARAEAAMDDAGLIAGLRKMDEIAESECLVRNRRIRVLIAMGRSDDAIAAFRKFDRTCGEWVRKYPWEFYARGYATDINWRLGEYLLLQNRHQDALPMLTYASNWGQKKATEAMARIFGDASNPLADPEKAEQLNELAQRQSMKRFTVPTDFAGTKFPFHVYTLEYGQAPLCKAQAEALDPDVFCAGFSGIDDQVIWVRELRGGEVPIDVITSFQKLYSIARENNVSFPDLAVYALGAAQEEGVAPTAVQLSAIRQLIGRNGALRPSVVVSTDKAGVAIGGYDVVEAAANGKAVFGSAQFPTVHAGALWLFQSEENRTRFKQDPERYVPQYGGFCVVQLAAGSKLPGLMKYPVRHRGKLYLACSEQAEKAFTAKPEEYISAADAAWRELAEKPGEEAAMTALGKALLGAESNTRANRNLKD